MDRYELKVTLGEIEALIAERNFDEALEIADTVDWSKVGSVRTLCKVSDLYKLRRRYETSAELLEMAYDRYPRGRHILYSLCELQLKLDDYVQALKLYNEYVSVAPRDPDRYILQYKLYKAQNVSLSEQIAVLEEFNRHDFREKWAYELALLYQKAGRTNLCVSACDEIIACFGDGRYVVKALELKNTVTPVTPDQAERYLRLTGRELVQPDEDDYEEPEETDGYSAAGEKDAPAEEKPEEYSEETASSETDKTVTETPETDGPAAEELTEEPSEEESGKEEGGETREEMPESISGAETGRADEDGADPVKLDLPDVEVGDDDLPGEAEQRRVSSMEDNMFAQKLQESIARSVRDMEEYDPYLRQETDGQYTMVIEEEQKPERQITGQLSITEIMEQWNRARRENEQRRSDEVRKKVIENTGPIIRQFYEDNQMDPANVEQIQREAVLGVPGGDIRRAKTKSWDPGEVRRALRTPMDEGAEEDDRGVRFDTHLFVTEDVREFPSSFDVEEPAEELYDDPAPAQIVDTPGNLGLPVAGEEEDQNAHPDLRAHRPMGQEDTAPILRAPENVRQMEAAVGKMRLEAAAGNVLITGDEGAGALRLTRELLRRYRQVNPNFVGRTAKTTGPGVNQDNLSRAVPRLPFGVLIIENAASMQDSAARALEKSLKSPGRSILVVMIDRRRDMEELLSRHPGLAAMFPARIDIAPLDDGALIGYARRYADKQDCVLDSSGAEALREHIDVLREQGYDPTLRDVRGMVDEAVYYAGRMSLGNLVEKVSRRGIEQERLVLKDRDFRHY